MVDFTSRHRIFAIGPGQTQRRKRFNLVMSSGCDDSMCHSSNMHVQHM